jgi:glucose-1-phosphatase
MSDSSIKNIIFDLGGVILNIDAQLTIDAFRRLGWNGSAEDEMINKGKKLFHSLEKGTTSPESFHEHFRQLTGHNCSDQEIDEAWTAMILDIPPDRVMYLQDLRKDYRIYLLSNTNEIHKVKFHRMFKDAYGYSFYDLFERNHYSHEMGLRKPDQNIYLQVLSENQLIAGESLFIDDVEENVIAAESVGINGLYIQPGTLLDILPQYLNASY